jgi:hypothetical protein
MNMLFHKMRKGKKGQIIAVLTVALIIFVIAALLVVNFGKNRVQDTRIENAAKAAVLGGGSAACVLLNSMANINDNMILNFAGFILQIQIVIASWIIDFVKAITTAYSTLTVFNWDSVARLTPEVMSLGFTTLTIILLIQGERLIGEAIKKMIDELNDKLPKNSRNSARQYAFSNAGVDEPKIPFSKSGCGDAWCYSLIETKFDTFMRELPIKNKADTNYGASTIDFDWDDSRTEHIVNNKISVTVTPVQKVPYVLMKLSNVASESSTINNYLNSQDMGWLGPLIRLGVSMADLIIGLVISIATLSIALSVALGIVAVVNGVMAVSYWTTCFSCSWAYCACCRACARGAYYTAAALIAVAAAVYIVLSLGDLYNVGSLPCFVWDKGNLENKYRIEARVNRTTNPASINYGLYSTDWPVVEHTESGTVKDGAIFPPSQNFDISPHF